MSWINVCDRCRGELHQKAYESSLVARRPRFYMITPTKSGAFDGWEKSKGRISLCQECTAQFMIFAQPKEKKNVK